MFRKNLVGILLDRSLSVSEIARAVGEKPADVQEDLQHFLRSLKHTEFEATITPAACRKCGFQFDTKKLGKPSKCPECKSTWIDEARIEVKARPPKLTSQDDPIGSMENQNG